MTIEKANSILSEILNSRETVLQGLQRLRPFKKKFQATNRKNKRKQQKETTEKQHQEEEKNVATSTDKVLFDRVTEAADFLMRMGEIDVYSQIREDFIPEQELLSQAADRQSRVQFTDSQQVTVSHHAKEKETMWEYKGADGQIHGPFPTSSIIAWRQQGYFTGGSAVDMRPIKSITLFQKGKEETLPPAAVAIGEPKKSAEQELLDDFEESEEEEETKSSEPVEAVVNEWKNSDTIDFSTF
jgi:CD2 antigen cytoplasmic tail-binding protein 2